MKKCEEIRDNISLYIDNELDEKYVLEFEQHIDDCKSCKKELDEIKAVVDLCLGASEQVDLPEDFSDKLHEKLMWEKEKMTSKNKVLGALGKYAGIFSSAAAILLIAFLVYGVWNNQVKYDVAMEDSTHKGAGYKDAGNNDKKDLKNLGKAMKPEVQSGADSSKPSEDKESRGLKFGASAEGTYDYGTEPSLRNNNGSIYFDKSMTDEDSTKANNYTVGDATQKKDALTDSAKAGTESMAFDIQPTASGDTILAVSATSSDLMQNTGNVTIYSNNTEGLMDEVKALAAGFQVQGEKSVRSNIELTSTSNVVDIKVLSSRYDELIALLVSKYGQNNIVANKMVNEDFTKKLEELNSSLSQLEAKINTAEKDGTSSGGLQEMKNQRDAVKSQIEDYRNASNYIDISFEIRKR